MLNLFLNLPVSKIMSRFHSVLQQRPTERVCSSFTVAEQPTRVWMAIGMKRALGLSGIGISVPQAYLTTEAFNMVDRLSRGAQNTDWENSIPISPLLLCPLPSPSTHFLPLCSLLSSTLAKLKEQVGGIRLKVRKLFCFPKFLFRWDRQIRTWWRL